MLEFIGEIHDKELFVSLKSDKLLVDVDIKNILHIVRDSDIFMGTMYFPLDFFAIGNHKAYVESINTKGSFSEVRYLYDCTVRVSDEVSEHDLCQLLGLYNEKLRKLS